MSSESPGKQSDNPIQISVVPATDQIDRIRGVAGQEIENWRHAKCGCVGALCYGWMVRGENIWVETDGTEFEDGTVEIWASPRRLTICGRPRYSRKRKEVARGGLQEEKETIFRVLDLPVDVEPSAITAKLNGSMLEICLPKAQAQKRGTQTYAA